MGTVCHACGYERKPTDQVPDWECPSCGKAYVKTSHDQDGSLPSPAPHFSSKPGNRLNTGFAYQQGQGGSAFNGTGKPKFRYGPVLGVVLAVFLVWGIPILGNPSSASAVLLHGDAGLVFIGLLAVWAMTFAARRLSANADASNPWSRFSALAKFSTLFCGLFFVIASMWLGHREQTELKIQDNGQRVMADVVRIYTGGCGKRSCSLYVEYAFTPTSEADSGAQPVHGYADIGTSDRPNDPELVYARAHRRVPIAYAVDQPKVSALNFNDDVFRVDPAQSYHHALGLLAKVLLGIYLASLALGAAYIWSNSKSRPSPN